MKRTNDYRASPLANPRISRRRILATAGAALTLPALPSLLYSRRTGARECPPAQRFLAYMFPNGHHMADHRPTGEGAGSEWSLPPMLEMMEDLKEHLLFVSGLENQQRRQEFGDHAIGCGSLLTARKPTKNAPILSMSVDQVIADQLQDCYGGLHSLQLGTHNHGPSDEFGTYYTRSISWRGPVEQGANGLLSFPKGDATPLGKEVDPLLVFNRMFQGTDPQATAEEIQRRLELRASVLDTVVPQIASLKPRLNHTDSVKVDELLTGIRALEKEIEVQKNAQCIPPAAPEANLEADFQKQLAVMHELMAVAFECDLTRVITFMMGDALNNRNLSFISEVSDLGGDSGDHSVSHHSGDTVLVAKYRAMVHWKMLRIAEFLRILRDRTDVDGNSLLSNSLVWISSELADGNRHNHDDIPVLVAGQLGGKVKTDRHVHYPTGIPVTEMKTFGDFFLNLMDLYGAKAEAFGDDGKELIAWHG